MRVSLMTNSLFFKARRERFSFFVRRAGGGRDTLKRTYICTPLFFRMIIQTQNPRTPIESTNASSCVNISAPFRVCKNRDRFFSVAFFGLYGGAGVLGFGQECKYQHLYVPPFYRFGLTGSVSVVIHRRSPLLTSAAEMTQKVPSLYPGLANMMHFEAQKKSAKTPKWVLLRLPLQNRKVLIKD